MHAIALLELFGCNQLLLRITPTTLCLASVAYQALDSKDPLTQSFLFNIEC